MSISIRFSLERQKLICPPDSSKTGDQPSPPQAFYCEVRKLHISNGDEKVQKAMFGGILKRRFI